MGSHRRYAMPRGVARKVLEITGGAVEDAARLDEREQCLARFLVSSRDAIPSAERARIGSDIAARPVTAEAVRMRDSRARGKCNHDTGD